MAGPEASVADGTLTAKPRSLGLEDENIFCSAFLFFGDLQMKE